MLKYLISAVTSTMCLVLIVFLIPLSIVVHRDARNKAITTATEQAITIASVAPTLTPKALSGKPVDGFAATVFLPDGGTMGVPAQRGPAITAATHCTPATTETTDGVEVLVPVAGRDGCPTVVRVLADRTALYEGAAGITLLLIVVSIALVLVGTLLAERLARGLLRSVHDLESTAGAIAGGDLHARARSDGPAEIRRAGAQLNLLAIRVDQLLNKQAQRTADLAHRLRTPLTSLRLDIDALPEGPLTQRLIQDHDTLSRVLNEVILAARRTTADGASPAADLVSVVTERVEFWSVLAEETDRKISCNFCAGPLLIGAGPAALAAALDALLGNIFAHTPAGVSIHLSIHRADTDALLVVDDAGPGFPNLDVTVRGRSKGSSTGLGLDIARHTAEDSGGRMRLGTPPGGGARVELLFGGLEAQS